MAEIDTGSSNLQADTTDQESDNFRDKESSIRALPDQELTIVERDEPIGSERDGASEDNQPEAITSDPKPSEKSLPFSQGGGTVAREEETETSSKPAVRIDNEENHAANAEANNPSSVHGEMPGNGLGDATTTEASRGDETGSGSRGGSSLADGAEMSEGEEGETDQSLVSEVVLDEINRRREEEKAIFQQLIEDCTRLQAEVEQLQIVKSELQAKFEVGQIELESAKEQTAEQEDLVLELRREIAELKKRNRVESSSRVDGSSRNRFDSYRSDGKPESSQTDLHNQPEDDSTPATHHWLEVKDLRLRLHRMSKDEQKKTDRICRLEKEAQSLNAVMDAVESIVGSEKMKTFRQAGEETGRGEKRTPITVGNIIEPVPQSSVCLIS